MKASPLGFLTLRDVEGNITSMQYMLQDDGYIHLDIGYETMVLDKDKLEDIKNLLECALENFNTN